MATAASPFTFAFCPVRSSKIAANTVRGRTTAVSFDTSKIVATAIAPKATWDNPSPIKENLFNTRETPNNEDERAIKTPTIIA